MSNVTHKNGKHIPIYEANIEDGISRGQREIETCHYWLQLKLGSSKF